ncbi:MAG: acyl-CoA mutase large subunit family protein, partial [Candidatus Zixiibacteriota bacterium]
SHHPPQFMGRLLDEFPPPKYEDWRAEVVRLLKGAPFNRRMMTHTHEGITLQPMYRREDINGLTHIASLPGCAPFLRGRKTLRNHGNAWDVAQEISYPIPDEFNRALKSDLDRGLTAVTLPLDRASRLGLDPDQAEVGQVGDGGVSISCMDDLTGALKGLDLIKVPVNVQCGSCGLPYLGLLIAGAMTGGVTLSGLRGAVAMDPFEELLMTGNLPMSFQDAFDEMAGMALWSVEHAPDLGTIWVHGEPFHDGGANAVQELAFALATGVVYLREMEKRGLAPEKIAPAVRFSFALGTNFFMEASKLRAARLLWYRILESCGVPEEGRVIWMHARTSRYTLTLYDPHINILRATTEALSGAIGGTDSLHVAPFDDHIRPANDFSRRIARNIQIIIKDEAQLTKVADPGGGSWYIEHLTNEIAKAAWSLFQTVEGMGGMAKAIEMGFPQKEVARVAEQRAEVFATRRDIIVGTNNYPNPNEAVLEKRPIDYRAIHAMRVNSICRMRISPPAPG